MACSPSCRKNWWRGSSFQACCPHPAPPEMDSSVWSKLPIELLETLVLPMLPAPSQARSRAVCRNWNRLLLLLRSRALRAISLGQAPCFVWPWDGKPSHLGEPLQHPPSGHRFLITSIEVHLPSCFQNFQSWQNGLVWAPVCVVNPVNRTWTELPHLPLYYTDTLVVPGSGSKFAVIVSDVRLRRHDNPAVVAASPNACRGGGDLFWCFDIRSYHSGTGEWSRTTLVEYDPLPAEHSIPRLQLLRQGLLYVLLPSHGDLLIISLESRVVRRVAGLRDAYYGDCVGGRSWTTTSMSTEDDVLLEHEGHSWLSTGKDVA